MQSYPIHMHNVVLFLVSSWKQTFDAHRVVSVADRAWENIDLTISSLWVRHPILITSTFGKCYDDSLHLKIIKYSTTRPARHIAREGVLPSIFTFMWDRSWANWLLANSTPPAALENRNEEGKI